MELNYVRNLHVLVAILLLLATGACSEGSAKEEEKKQEKEVQLEIKNENTFVEEETVIEEENKKLNEESDVQEGEEMASITIDLESLTGSFDVNGVFIGDTVERVVEVLGEPLEKPFGDERYEYSFQDAWYGEQMMIVFDNVGVAYIQANTTTEKGKLLTNHFIQQFPGTIYQATEELTQDFKVLSILVFVINADSILIVEKYEDEISMVARSYLVAPDYSWDYSRGWNIETFNDVSKFRIVDSTTAIANQ